MAWMPRTSQSLWHGCHWLGSWHWTSVTFKSMVLKEQRKLGVATHNSSLALVLALPQHPTLFLICSVRTSLETSHCSAVAGIFAGHGDKSLLQKLNGVEAGGIEWGWLGPLGSTCPSVMAWVISQWPSPRLACLAQSLGFFANPTDGTWQC